MRGFPAVHSLFLRHVFGISFLFCMLPCSCLVFKICVAHADFGLLILMYPWCSVYLVLIFLYPLSYVRCTKHYAL